MRPPAIALWCFAGSILDLSVDVYGSECVKGGQGLQQLCKLQQHCQRHVKFPLLAQSRLLAGVPLMRSMPEATPEALMVMRR